MIIGVTGNIGSGKSLAVSFLRELGAATIDADRVGHSVLLPGGRAYDGVIHAFGRAFLDEEGRIDRKRLGAYIFSDPSGRRSRVLNALTHPAISAEIKQQIDAFRSQGYATIVVEAALLADSPLREMVDQLWLIQAGPEVAVARAAQRDGCPEESIRQRRQRQRDQADLVGLADVVIENDGSPEELREKLRAALAETLPCPENEPPAEGDDA